MIAMIQNKEIIYNYHQILLKKEQADSLGTSVKSN